MLMNRAETGSSVTIQLDSPQGEILSEWRLQEEQTGPLLFDFKAVSGTHDLYFTFQNTGLEPATGTCAITWLLFLAV